MITSFKYIYLIAISLSALLGNASAQNIGIGVANPTKGKLEIAGALGNQTTVLTIGSDGTGISLQRNWPTIGFNQYRDANNLQRFIGTGYAGSIFLSQADGSIIFTQMGQGNANQEIATTTYPLVINAFGTTTTNGLLVMKNGANVEKEILFTTAPKIVSNETGTLRNLLAFAYGHIKSDGSKYRGTGNFTAAYSAGLSGYLIYFTEQSDEAIMTVTPRSQAACFATYYRVSQGILGVFIWNKDGQKIQSDFTFSIFQ